MENSRLYVFTEYFPASQSAHGWQAFQKLILFTESVCIAVFRDFHYGIFRSKE